MRISYGKIVDTLPIEVFVNGNKNEAIWDTGANLCVIHNEVAKKLKLEPFRSVKCSTPMGIYETKIYKIDLKIDNLLFENIEVLGGNMTDDFLIGMSIINKGELNIKNQGETILSFEVV
ncbi:MAG: hypothetical protein Ta2D_04930 [Rickettsiales bacterium]|nr:MAG: hypothetical protein Ta2D_04930 [Rickettsiales bacterium]